LFTSLGLAKRSQKNRFLELPLANGQTHKVNPTTKARYLRVIMDDRLKGNAHLDLFKEPASQELPCFLCIMGSTWGMGAR
jgi:hypothetical protein